MTVLTSAISYWVQQAQAWQANANTAYQSGVWGSGPTWHQNADYVYGRNRVYGNGASWESEYGQEVALYNDAVYQIGVWVTRANQAWGPTRAWAQGESWEAAFYRTQPSGLWQAGLNCPQNNGHDNNYQYGDILYLPMNGYYTIGANGSMNEYTAWWNDHGNWIPELSILVNGGVAADSGWRNPVGWTHNGGGSDLHCHLSVAYYPAGTQIRLRVKHLDNYPNGWACFVPTPAYPH